MSVTILLALSLLGLAGALILFLRAGALERRPELRLTREHELVRLAAEHRRRQAEAEAVRALSNRRLGDARPGESPPGDAPYGPPADPRDRL